MTDHDDAVHAVDDPAHAEDEVGGPVTTGHPRVDDVLRALESLPELPVDQHVAVFEAAHVGLREALSSAGPAGPGRG